jgi:hypothetical protein
MKQAEDTYTIDMLGDSLTPHATCTPKVYYRFYVKAHGGLTTEWTGLTRKQARDMYAYTSAHQPSNVVAYGWEEVSELRYSTTLTN